MKKKIGSPYKAKDWKEEEIIAILQLVIDEISSSPTEIYHSFLLSKAGLPKATLSDWCKRSEWVKAKHQELIELTEAKLVSEMVKSRSTVNTVGGIFLLKCHHGYIEEEKRIKRDESIVTDTVIDVGFSDED